MKPRRYVVVLAVQTSDGFDYTGSGCLQRLTKLLSYCTIVRVSDIIGIRDRESGLGTWRD